MECCGGTVYSSGPVAFAVGSGSKTEAVAVDYTAVAVDFSVAVLQPSLCLASLPPVLLRHEFLWWIGGFSVSLGRLSKNQHDPAVFGGPVAGPSHVNKLDRKRYNDAEELRWTERRFQWVNYVVDAQPD